MTLSFNKLNEIAELYESIAASEQEQLNENDIIKQGLTRQAMANAFKKSGGFNSPGFKKLGNSSGLENSIKQGLTRQAMANAYNDKDVKKDPQKDIKKVVDTKPAASTTVLAKKGGVEGKLDKSTGKFTSGAFSSAEKSRYGGSGGSQGSKVVPTKPAAPKPAIGTTPSGTKFERRTPTRKEMDAAKGAGGGEAGVKAAVAASKPAATSTLKSATDAASKPSAFTPKTTAVASSTTDKGAVPATNAIAAAPKPAPLCSSKTTTICSSKTTSNNT